MKGFDQITKMSFERKEFYIISVLSFIKNKCDHFIISKMHSMKEKIYSMILVWFREHFTMTYPMNNQNSFPVHKLSIE